MFRSPADGTLLGTARAARNVTLFTQPDEGLAPLQAVIDGARRSLDVEVYIFTERALLDRLKTAKERGVRVRVLMEREPFNPGNPADPLPVNFAAARYLKEAGIDHRWTGDRFAFTHEKSLIADGKAAVVMTSNFTKGAFTKNREYGIVDREPADAAVAQQIFDADWDQRPVAIQSRNLVVSPDNSRSQLESLIRGARKSVHVQDEVMADPAVFALLGEKARSGVNVRVQLGRLSGSADEDARRALEAAGVRQVRVVDRPTLHAKMILVDSLAAYVGSVNLTTNSMDKNRELGVIVEDPRTVASLVATAEKDWAGGTI